MLVELVRAGEREERDREALLHGLVDLLRLASLDAEEAEAQDVAATIERAINLANTHLTA